MVKYVNLFWKNHNTLTVRGGDRGVVNTYGQPDHKKKVFFLQPPLLLYWGKTLLSIAWVSNPTSCEKNLGLLCEGWLLSKVDPRWKSCWLGRYRRDCSNNMSNGQSLLILLILLFLLILSLYPHTPPLSPAHLWNPWQAWMTWRQIGGTSQCVGLAPLCELSTRWTWTRRVR